jgi:hypothetical protein
MMLRNRFKDGKAIVRDEKSLVYVERTLDELNFKTVRSRDTTGVYWTIILDRVPPDAETYKQYHLSLESMRKARKTLMRMAIVHKFRERMSKEDLEELRRTMRSSVTISAIEMQQMTADEKDAELVGAQDETGLDPSSRQAINKIRAKRSGLLSLIDEVSTIRRKVVEFSTEALDANAKLFQLIKKTCDISAEEACIRAVAQAQNNKEFRSGAMLAEIKKGFMTRTKKKRKRVTKKKGGNQEDSKDAKTPAPVITTQPTGHASSDFKKLVGLRTSQQGYEPFIKSKTSATISWTLQEKVMQWERLNDRKEPTWVELGYMLDKEGYKWVLSEGDDVFSPEGAQDEYPGGPRAALTQNIQEGGLQMHGIVKGSAGSMSDRFAKNSMPGEAVSDQKGSASTGIPKITITMDTESEDSSGPTEGKGEAWTETVKDYVDTHARTLHNFLRNLPKHRHGELQGNAKNLVMECMMEEEEAALRRDARSRKKRGKQRAKRKQRATCNDGTFATTGGPHEEDEGPEKNPKKPKPALRVKKKSGVMKTVQRTPQSTSSGEGGTRKTDRRETDRATPQRQPSTAARGRGRSWRTQDGRGRPRGGNLGNTATAGYPGAATRKTKAGSGDWTLKGRNGRPRTGTLGNTAEAGYPEATTKGSKASSGGWTVNSRYGKLRDARPNSRREHSRKSRTHEGNLDNTAKAGCPGAAPRNARIYSGRAKNLKWARTNLVQKTKLSWSPRPWTVDELLTQQSGRAMTRANRGTLLLSCGTNEYE